MATVLKTGLIVSGITQQYSSSRLKAEFNYSDSLFTDANGEYDKVSDEVYVKGRYVIRRTPSFYYESRYHRWIQSKLWHIEYSYPAHTDYVIPTTYRQEKNQYGQSVYVSVPGYQKVNFLGAGAYGRDFPRFGGRVSRGTVVNEGRRIKSGLNTIGNYSNYGYTCSKVLFRQALSVESEAAIKSASTDVTSISWHKLNVGDTAYPTSAASGTISITDRLESDTVNFDPDNPIYDTLFTYDRLSDNVDVPSNTPFNNASLTSTTARAWAHNNTPLKFFLNEERIDADTTVNPGVSKGTIVTYIPPPLHTADTIDMDIKAQLYDEVGTNDMVFRSNFGGNAAGGANGPNNLVHGGSYSPQHRNNRIPLWAEFLASAEGFNPGAYPFIEAAIPFTTDIVNGQTTRDPIKLFPEGHVHAGFAKFSGDTFLRSLEQVDYHGNGLSTKFRNSLRGLGTTDHYMDKREIEVTFDAGGHLDMSYNNIFPLPNAIPYNNSTDSSPQHHPNNLRDPIIPYWVRVTGACADPNEAGFPNRTNGFFNGYYKRIADVNSQACWRWTRSDPPHRDGDPQTNANNNDGGPYQDYRIVYEPTRDKWQIRDHNAQLHSGDTFTYDCPAEDYRVGSDYLVAYECKSINLPNRAKIPILSKANATQPQAYRRYSVKSLGRGRPKSVSWNQNISDSSYSGITTLPADNTYAVAENQYDTDGIGAGATFDIVVSGGNVTSITVTGTSERSREYFYIGERVTLNAGDLNGFFFYISELIEEDDSPFVEGWNGAIPVGAMDVEYDIYLTHAAASNGNVTSNDEIGYGFPPSVRNEYTKALSNIMAAETEYEPRNTSANNFKRTDFNENAYLHVFINGGGVVKAGRKFDDDGNLIFGGPPVFSRPDSETVDSPGDEDQFNRILPLIDAAATNDNDGFGAPVFTCRYTYQNTSDNSNATSTISIPLIALPDEDSPALEHFTISPLSAEDSPFGGEFDYMFKLNWKLEARDSLSAPTEYYQVVDLRLLDKSTEAEVDHVHREKLLFTHGENFAIPDQSLIKNRFLFGGGTSPIPQNHLGGVNPGTIKNIRILKNDQLLHSYTGIPRKRRQIAKLFVTNTTFNETKPNNKIVITLEAGTGNAVPGQSVPFEIIPTGGGLSLSDFVGLDSFTGEMILDDTLKSTVIFVLNPDQITEGAEGFIFRITDDTISAGGTRLLERTIQINDTSRLPEYVLTGEPDQFLKMRGLPRSVSSANIRGLDVVDDFFDARDRFAGRELYRTDFGSYYNGVNNIYNKSSIRSYSTQEGDYDIIRPAFFQENTSFLNTIVLKNWGKPIISPGFALATFTRIPNFKDIWNREGGYPLLLERGYLEMALCPSGFDFVFDEDDIPKFPNLLDYVLSGRDTIPRIPDTIETEENGRIYQRVSQNIFRGLPTKTELLRYPIILDDGTKYRLKLEDLDEHSLVFHMMDYIWQIELENDSTQGDTGDRWVINLYERSEALNYSRQSFGRRGWLELSTKDGLYERIIGAEAFVDLSDPLYARTKYRMYQDASTSSIRNLQNPTETNFEFVYESNQHPFYVDETIFKQPNLNLTTDTLSTVGDIDFTVKKLKYDRERWVIREGNYPFRTLYQDVKTRSTTYTLADVQFAPVDYDSPVEYAVQQDLRDLNEEESAEGLNYNGGYARNFFLRDQSKNAVVTSPYTRDLNTARILLDAYNTYDFLDIGSGEPRIVSRKFTSRFTRSQPRIESVFVPLMSRLVGIHEQKYDSPDSPNDLDRNEFTARLQTKHIPDGARVPFTITGFKFDKNSPDLDQIDAINSEDLFIKSDPIPGISKLLLRRFDSPNGLDPNGLYTCIAGNPAEFVNTAPFRGVRSNGVQVEDRLGEYGDVTQLTNPIEFIEWSVEQENSDSPRYNVIGKVNSATMPDKRFRDDPRRLIQRVVAYKPSAWMRRAPWVKLYLGSDRANSQMINDELSNTYPNLTYSADEHHFSPASTVQIKRKDGSSSNLPFLSSAGTITRRDGANIITFVGSVEEDRSATRKTSDRIITGWQQISVVSTYSYKERYFKYRRLTLFGWKSYYGTRTVHAPAVVRVRLTHTGNQNLKNLSVGDTVKFLYAENLEGKYRAAHFGTSAVFDEIGVLAASGAGSEKGYYGLMGLAPSTPGQYNIYGIHNTGEELSLQSNNSFTVRAVNANANWFEININVNPNNRKSISGTRLNVSAHVGFFAYANGVDTLPATRNLNRFLHGTTPLAMFLYGSGNPRTQYSDGSVLQVLNEDPREFALNRLSAAFNGTNGYPAWPTLVAPTGFDLSKMDFGRYIGFNSPGEFVLHETDINVNDTWDEGSAKLLTIDDVIENIDSSTTTKYYRTVDFPNIKTTATVQTIPIEENASPGGTIFLRSLAENTNGSLRGEFIVTENSPGVDSEENATSEITFFINDDNRNERDEVLTLTLDDNPGQSLRYKILDNFRVTIDDCPFVPYPPDSPGVFMDSPNAKDNGTYDSPNTVTDRPGRDTGGEGTIYDVVDNYSPNEGDVIRGPNIDIVVDTDTGNGTIYTTNPGTGLPTLPEYTIDPDTGLPTLPDPSFPDGTIINDRANEDDYYICVDDEWILLDDGTTVIDKDGNVWCWHGDMLVLLQDDRIFINKNGDLLAVDCNGYVIVGPDDSPTYTCDDEGLPDSPGGFTPTGPAGENPTFTTVVVGRNSTFTAEDINTTVDLDFVPSDESFEDVIDFIEDVELRWEGRDIQVTQLASDSPQFDAVMGTYRYNSTTDLWENIERADGGGGTPLGAFYYDDSFNRWQFNSVASRAKIVSPDNTTSTLSGSKVDGWWQIDRNPNWDGGFVAALSKMSFSHNLDNITTVTPLSAEIIRNDTGSGTSKTYDGIKFTDPGVSLVVNNDTQPPQVTLGGSYTGLIHFPNVQYRYREGLTDEEKILKFQNNEIFKVNSSEIIVNEQVLGRDFSPGDGTIDNSPTQYVVASRDTTNNTIIDQFGTTHRVIDLDVDIEGKGWPPDAGVDARNIHTFESDPTARRDLYYWIAWDVETVDVDPATGDTITSVSSQLIQYKKPVLNSTFTSLATSLQNYIEG